MAASGSVHLLVKQIEEDIAVRQKKGTKLNDTDNKVLEAARSLLRKQDLDNPENEAFVPSLTTKTPSHRSDRL